VLRTVAIFKMISNSFALTFVVGLLIVGSSFGSKLALREGESKAKQFEQLDDAGKVNLSWELNAEQTEITFELWAETPGYVGFGISPQGGMAGADIFIAGVYSNGTAYSSVIRVF